MGKYWGYKFILVSHNTTILEILAFHMLIVTTACSKFCTMNWNFWMVLHIFLSVAVSSTAYEYFKLLFQIVSWWLCLLADADRLGSLPNFHFWYCRESLNNSKWDAWLVSTVGKSLSTMGHLYSTYEIQASNYCFDMVKGKVLNIK